MLKFYIFNRIIGAVLVVIGLYLVLYGKSIEKAFAAREAASTITSTQEHDGIRAAATATAFKTSSLTQPLLPSSTSDNV